MVSMIVAAGEDNAIGKDHDMLWHLPNDFKFFKRTTLGHPIIMGRKTIESLGKPLPGRVNMVITRNKGFEMEGVEVFHDLKKAVSKAKKLDTEEVFVIGGGQIYELGMNLADRIYLTRVHGTFPEANVYFPEVDQEKWDLIESTFHPKDERHAYDMHFLTYDRANK